jgi:DNA/RNA-binding domain of Phe-tRNA-synthetase-like protein
LGETEERAPHPGEVIYRDDIGAICRRWNWKEADRTKLTEETVNAVLVIEALPPVGQRELESALLEFEEWIRRYCGGMVQTFVLTASNGEIEL